jgi:hypothetical protein
VVPPAPAAPVAPVPPTSPAKAKDTVHISFVARLPLLITEKTGTWYVPAIGTVTLPLIEKSMNVFWIPFTLILNLPLIEFVLFDKDDNHAVASLSGKSVELKQIAVIPDPGLTRENFPLACDAADVIIVLY